MHKRGLLLIVGLVLLASGVACTDSTGGTATPGATAIRPEPSDPPTDEPSSGGAEPTVVIPARPQDLGLDGVKPCSLFTSPQLKQLKDQFKFDEPPESGNSGGAYNAPLCSIAQSAEPFNSVDVLLVTTEGIEPWLSGKRNVDAWLVSVGGFPADDYKLAGADDEECVTSVSVADDQQLMIELQALQDTDYRQLCQVTEKAAAMALQTLQSLR